MQGLRPFFRYFEFSGRSGRAEYWQFIAYIFITSLLLGLLELRATVEAASMGISKIPVWSSIFSVLVFIPATAATFRRLHDRNKSGWLVGAQIALAAISVILMFSGLLQAAAGSSSSVMPVGLALYLVSSIVSIYTLVQLALPGDDYENHYGAQDDEPFDIRTKFAARGVPVEARARRPVRASADDVDGFAKLEKLADLHSRGLLTAEEFEAHKSRLLAEML